MNRATSSRTIVVVGLCGLAALVVAPPALSGTVGKVAKFDAASSVNDSVMTESGGRIGVGTADPKDTMSVRFDNGSGQYTGYAVQNTSSAASAYSGNLFYDHNGSLSLFQGYNNATGEYRINNVSPNVATRSINFLIGSTSRFFVGATGKIGMGTTTPETNLHVKSADGEAALTLEAGAGKAAGVRFGPQFADKWALGTSPARSFVIGDEGSNGPAVEIAPGNNVGISANPSANYRVAIAHSSTTANGSPQSSGGLLVQNSSSGDSYATVEAGNGAGSYAALNVRRAGTDLYAVGSSETSFSIFDWGANLTRLRIMRHGQANAGFVAIGSHTPLDKLDVAGDIRLGTGYSAFVGCLKNNVGAGIAGTCPSDARYKQGITPITTTLAKIAALQPVEFSWRTDEFPEKGFGPGRQYGLIAQDVEKTLPELVLTGEDGYKAVDYSRLPLLALQAIRELASGNDQLSSAVTSLHAKIAAQQAEITAQHTQIAAQQAEIDAQHTQIAAQDAKIQSLEQRLAALEKLVLTKP